MQHRAIATLMLVLLTMGIAGGNVSIGDWTMYTRNAGQSDCQTLRVVGLVTNNSDRDVSLMPAVYVDIYAGDDTVHQARGHIFFPSISPGDTTCWVATATRCPAWATPIKARVRLGNVRGVASGIQDTMPIEQSEVWVQHTSAGTAVRGKLRNVSSHDVVVGSIVSTLLDGDHIVDCAETGLDWPYWIQPGSIRPYTVFHTTRFGNEARVQVGGW